MLYQLSDATVFVEGEQVLSHINFEVHGTEKIAVVGRNGAGKSTLLRAVFGELPIERDDKRREPAVQSSRAIRIGMLRQQAFSDMEKTVEEEMMNAYWEAFKKDKASEKENSEIAYDHDRFLYECEYDRLLTGFGFSKEDKRKTLSQFSGGEQTKLALIRLLLEKPDLLLLDEPTNHLDFQTVEWLEQYLKQYDKAVIMVSHDRFFLDQVADVVYEVTSHETVRYAGNYSQYKIEKRKRIALQRKTYEAWETEKKRLEDLIERFKHKPNKAAMARSKKKVLERMEEPPKPYTEEAHLFTGNLTPRVLGGKWVYEAEHLKVGYDKPLFETSLKIRRGQKIAILGANGAGKTTLLKTIAGLLPPVSGKGELGFQILMGYYDQKSGEITSEKTVLEHFHELFPSMTEKELRTTLAAYLFDGRTAAKQVNALSGGEKSRLVLAELLQSRPNFCVLDEPTNHMDIPAKETLESAFKAFQGTILFVSHDRYFIKQVADALLMIQDGEVYYYPFGYEHFLEHSRKRAAGICLSAQIKAEDAALLAGLKAVPRREYIPLKEQSEEAAYWDWKLRIADEAFEEARSKYEDKLQRINLKQTEKKVMMEAQTLPEEEKLKADWLKKWLGEKETEQTESLKAEAEFTKACLVWYETYSELE